jgi:DNA-binding NarL/FixJ family response regulator
LRRAQISDELAIVLPIAEEAAIVICFNQAAGRFDAQAISLAEAIYPVIQEANRLHLERSHAPAAHANRDVHESGGAGSLPTTGLLRPLERFCKVYRLSARECELLALAKEGFANRSIAARLGLAVGTVKNYKRRLYRKLGVCSERAMLRVVAEFLAAGHHA